MEIRAVEAAETKLVRQFLIAQGWAHRVADQQRFELMLANSQHALVALEADHIAHSKLAMERLRGTKGGIECE